jgi:hypothetical protein
VNGVQEIHLNNYFANGFIRKDSAFLIKEDFNPGSKQNLRLLAHPYVDFKHKVTEANLLYYLGLFKVKNIKPQDFTFDAFL